MRFSSGFGCQRPIKLLTAQTESVIERFPNPKFQISNLKFSFRLFRVFRGSPHPNPIQKICVDPCSSVVLPYPALLKILGSPVWALRCSVINSYSYSGVSRYSTSIATMPEMLFGHDLPDTDQACNRTTSQFPISNFKSQISNLKFQICVVRLHPINPCSSVFICGSLPTNIPSSPIHLRKSAKSADKKPARQAEPGLCKMWGCRVWCSSWFVPRRKCERSSRRLAHNA